MLATDRAAYDQNDVESDAAAYRIGICIKNWVRECVVYFVLVVTGLIVPWFVDTSSW